MNIASSRTFSVLSAVLLTIAMLIGIRAGFDASPVAHTHSLAR